MQNPDTKAEHDKIAIVLDIATGKRYSNGGGDPPMELIERVGNLETDMRDVRERLTRIEVRLDTFSTKEDMHREFNVQTWRIIGAVLAAGGLFFAAAKLIN